MPVHEWTRVDEGIVHALHHVWIGNLQMALNAGKLPPEYYALAEQIAGFMGSDVLTLQQPNDPASSLEPAGDLGIALAPPRIRNRFYRSILEA